MGYIENKIFYWKIKYAEWRCAMVLRDKVKGCQLGTAIGERFGVSKWQQSHTGQPQAKCALISSEWEYFEDETIDRVAKAACERSKAIDPAPMTFLTAGLLTATIQQIFNATRQLVIDGYLFTGKIRQQIIIEELKHSVDTGLHAIIYLCKCTKEYPNWQEAEALGYKTNQVYNLIEENTTEEVAIQILGEGSGAEVPWGSAVA